MDFRLVEEDPLDWEKEPSENFKAEHLLYLGIHKDLWSQWSDLENIQVNFFMTSHALIGLSVDWSKYAIPEDTLQHLKPSLEIYGIAEIGVGELKDAIEKHLLPLQIQHDPIKQPPYNRAHSLLLGITTKNKATMKRRLYKLFRWVPNMKPNPTSAD